MKNIAYDAKTLKNVLFSAKYVRIGVSDGSPNINLITLKIHKKLCLFGQKPYLIAY